jgi:subtilisin family serine protease
MAALLVACSGTQPLVSTPIENIDTMPLKIEGLTEKEKQHWGHADLVTDTIPGMSVDKAYAELLGNKKGKTIIVAVLDSGMDLEHEDLDDVLWTNKKEIAGNGKDDDGNGYIDDVHGYNFLGDSYDENLEMTRIVKLKLGDAALQTTAQNELNEKLTKDSVEKTQIGAIYSAINEAHLGVAKALGKEDYSQEELRALAAKDANMIQNSGILSQAFAFAQNIPDATNIPDVLEEMKGYVDYLTESVDYNLNVAFDGRKVVGDNPYDIKDTKYGNGNPSHVKEDESHGTHVAGIIAAERNNGLGANGVANNVELMSIRAVPNGDEYDKDIALGIRYAVDNGAKIINCSFGKSYSPNADWVYDALKYAAKKDVLIVHAAGNDGKDLDDPANPNFPNDQIDNGPEMANNVITVGALAPKYGPEMVASFSNYGKINVDVLAPGAKIYSTVPESKYKTMGGTSMAAPAVAGVAAVVWGKYPTLKAAQIKKIIMESGVSFNTEVIVAGDDSNVKSFGDITTSGKMANLYNALILAEQVSKGKVNL